MAAARAREGSDRANALRFWTPLRFTHESIAEGALALELCVRPCDDARVDSRIFVYGPHSAYTNRHAGTTGSCRSSCCLRRSARGGARRRAPRPRPTRSCSRCARAWRYSFAYAVVCIRSCWKAVMDVIDDFEPDVIGRMSAAPQRVTGAIEVKIGVASLLAGCLELLGFEDVLDLCARDAAVAFPCPPPPPHSTYAHHENSHMHAHIGAPFDIWKPVCAQVRRVAGRARGAAEALGGPRAAAVHDRLPDGALRGTHAAPSRRPGRARLLHARRMAARPAGHRGRAAQRARRGAHVVREDVHRLLRHAARVAGEPRTAVYMLVCAPPMRLMHERMRPPCCAV